MRRHRRIDVWGEDGVLVVDAFFRDICWDPDGTQQALHEYTVTATVDRADQTLVSVKTTPRVLPFPECQWAAPHADKLVGMPVADFRTRLSDLEGMLYGSVPEAAKAGFRIKLTEDLLYVRGPGVVVQAVEELLEAVAPVGTRRDREGRDRP